MFRENTHNVWNIQITANENKKIVRYVQETLKFRTPLLLENLPELGNSFNIFKRKIKNWKCEIYDIGYPKLFKKI